jgi:CheY-like chemotaxis protein
MPRETPKNLNSKNTGSKSFDGKKVLVAEDDAGVRRVITLTLEHAGFEVIGAQDGLEALEKATKLLPDAVLLDIGMPKMDGLTVCKKLRAAPRTAQIPIGFLTAEVGQGTYQEAAKAGSLLFMPKPFKPEKLVSFVHVLLSSVRKEKPA